MGKLAAPVFIAVFLTSLAVLDNWLLSKAPLVNWAPQAHWTSHREFLEGIRPEHGLLLALACLAFSWTMAKFIDINKFSLQAMYRSRLIRAYLGASNGKPEINRFIGFDRTDNFYLKNLTPSTQAVPRGEYGVEPGFRRTSGLAAASGRILYRFATALRQRNPWLSPKH